MLNIQEYMCGLALTSYDKIFMYRYVLWLAHMVSPIFANTVELCH